MTQGVAHPGHAAGSPSSLLRLHQITNSIDINGLPTGVAGHPVPQPAVAPPVQSKGHSSSSNSSSSSSKPRQNKSKSRSTAAAATAPTPAQTAGHPALLGAGYHCSGVVTVQPPHHAVPPHTFPGKGGGTATDRPPPSSHCPQHRDQPRCDAPIGRPAASTTTNRPQSTRPSSLPRGLPLPAVRPAVQPPPSSQT